MTMILQRKLKGQTKLSKGISANSYVCGILINEAINELEKPKWILVSDSIAWQPLPEPYKP